MLPSLRMSLGSPGGAAEGQAGGGSAALLGAGGAGSAQPRCPGEVTTVLGNLYISQGAIKQPKSISFWDRKVLLL